jgi:single-stranded-DNA-specific exonuclease
LVITHGEEGYKGSGRSIENFNLIEAIREAGDYLDKFGGHPAACGFSLKDDNLEGFRKKMEEVAEEKLSNIDLTPKLKIEAEIPLTDITEELIEGISALEPFGQDNEKPRLMSREATIMEILNMGGDGQHLKLKLKADGSGFLSAIGFGQSEKWQELAIGDTIDIVHYLEMNHFNGRSEPQLKIIDIRKAA